MKNKKNQYTPDFISKNLYMMHSYEEIIRSVRKGVPVKDVKLCDHDLKLQFIRMSREEVLQFHQQVIKLEEMESIRTQIIALRNKLSNKELKLEMLLNER